MVRYSRSALRSVREDNCLHTPNLDILHSTPMTSARFGVPTIFTQFIQCKLLLPRIGNSCVEPNQQCFHERLDECLLSHRVVKQLWFEKRNIYAGSLHCTSSPKIPDNYALWLSKLNMRIYKPGTRTGGRCCTRTLFVTNCVLIVCNTLSVVYYVYESVVNPALQQHEPSTPQLFPKKIGSSLLSLGSVVWKPFAPPNHCS